MVSEHLVFIKGVELVFFEFKEVVLELALRMKEFVDASAVSKLKSLVKRFLQDIFLKRLIPYIKFSQENRLQQSLQQDENSNQARTWPESDKDKVIKEAKEKRRQEEAERERLRLEEE